MDNNYIEVTLWGYFFYMKADRYKDLAYIDGKLVNISDSTIMMAENFDGGSYSNSYPRITCSAMSQCNLYASRYDNAYPIESNIELAHNQKYNINMLGTNGLLSVIFLILFTLLGIKLLWKKS